MLKVIDRYMGRFLASVLPRPPLPEGDLLQKILVVRPGGVGDAVLLIPTLIQLKAFFPDVQVDVLAEERNAQIFGLWPAAGQVVSYDSYRDFIKLAGNRYDLIIDTEQWHRLSAVVARLIRSDRKIGFGTNERSRLFTDVVGYSHDDYEMHSFLRLLEPLSKNPVEPFSEKFLVVPANVKSCTELLGIEPCSYVVLFPGASISERRWGGQHFAELAERIVGLGYKVVVVGGACDSAAAEDMVSHVSSVINMAGKTSFLETASILSGAALLVSGDSGVLHVAVGLGVRTVSLFGPGIAVKWAPGGEKHHVINHNLPCSPCTKFGYTAKCKIGAPCIQDISCDEVFSAVKQQLNQYEKRVGNV